ncbi:MAG: sulfur carrier protein ThiS [Spirochaetia bacterium]|nr:sulfur carrier protein ThiS [Spirochaetia bacterium]
MIINGENHEIKSGFSILELIQKFKLDPDMVAVELNGSICRRESWEKIQLKENDRIELLKFVGGG